MTLQEARNYRTKIEDAAELQNDEQALNSIYLFPVWKENIFVTENIRYRYNDKLYRVVQSHTTQSGWTPDITPALWTEVSLNEWPNWVQPTGVQDAYNTGDKVTYNGQHYISKIDGNTWSPSDYPAGWELQS